MLDEFIWGKVSRISPEAPVPIVEVSRESYYPGGAANVARNLREFTGHVSVMGLVGDDRARASISRPCSREGGIGLERAPGRRPLADHRQDAHHRPPAAYRALGPREAPTAECSPTSTTARWQLARAERWPDFDAVIIEDYAQGLPHPGVRRRHRRAGARGAGKILTVDPNPRNDLLWQRGDGHQAQPRRGFPGGGQAAERAGRSAGAGCRRCWRRRGLAGDDGKRRCCSSRSGEQGMLLFRARPAALSAAAPGRRRSSTSAARATRPSRFSPSRWRRARRPRRRRKSPTMPAAWSSASSGTATLSPEELLASFERSDI